MKLLRCIIVEDNELDRLTIANYLSYFPEIDVIKILESPRDAQAIIEEEKPDIIFLDIRMPEMTGLELREKVVEVPVCVFTTDYPEYAVESFELETLDYLVKPYSLERFSQTVERIKEYIGIRKKACQFEAQSDEEYIFIKSGHKKIKLVIDNVLYMNSLQNYTVIYTPDEKQYILSPLGTLLNNKSFSSFIRIHKSYAVNRKHIKSMNSREITLSNDVKIPIGRSYKNQLRL